MKHKDYAGSVQEIVRKFNSNAVLGLTHKSARARFGRTSRSMEREFYCAPKKTWTQLVAPCVSDFSFWLMLLTAGTLAFFDHTRLALTCFICVLVNLVLSVIASRLSSFYESGLALGFRPKVKVLREGKLFTTDCRYVVRGDIVLLSKGDVVPFDARLLTAEHLTVSVYCGRDDSGKERFVACEKDADARLDGGRDIPPEGRTNMVTAGSVILSGSARVIVTETGSYTYIGALTGGIFLGRAEEKNSLVPTVLRWTRNVGIVLLLISIPLTVLAYFLGEPHDLAVSFLTVLSLSTALFPGWIIALLDLSATRTIYRFVCRRETSSGAFLRTATVSERLASMDVLALLGKSMLTDGRPRVIAVFADGSLSSGGERKSSACRALTEKALLLARKANEVPTRPSESADALNELLRKELFEYAAFVEADTEMLKIRYRVNDYRASTREKPIEVLEYFDTAEPQNLSRILCSSFGEVLLFRCTHISEGGKIVDLTPEKRAAVREAIRSCAARGGVVCCYAERAVDGYLTFLGFIAYAELVSRGTREAFSSLSATGLRILLFLDGESEADRFYARASGIVVSDAEIAMASRFRSEEKSITQGFGAYSAYLGFSKEEVQALLEALEENGMCTGAVAIDDGDGALLKSVSVPIACGEAVRGYSRADTRELSELPIVGVRHGTEASEQTKMYADVLIPRASRSGGGLPAIERAVLLGRRIGRNRRAFLHFLMLSFGLSGGWLIPVLFGLDNLYAAVSLSFAHLIVNVFVGAFILLRNGGDEGIRLPQTEFRSRRDVVKSGTYQISAGALVGFGLSVLPLILQRAGVDISSQLSSIYRGVSLFLALAFAFLYVCFRGMRRHTHKSVKKKT